MAKVKIGQIWADNDPRSLPRQLEVVDVQTPFNVAYVKNTATGKRTRISLDRFVPTKTGYRLVKDVE